MPSLVSPRHGAGLAPAPFPIDEVGARRWIAKGDHWRMCAALIEIADAFGDPVKTLVRSTLDTLRPARGGAAATKAHYGLDLDRIQRLTLPLVHALDEMLPGFAKWLEITKFGDDQAMTAALLKWAELMAIDRQETGLQNRAANRVLSVKPLEPFTSTQGD